MPILKALALGCALICLVYVLPHAAAAEGNAGLFRTSTKAVAAIESGPVAKACGLRGKALGKVIEKGPGKWKLHDTAPGSTAVRDFYLTGFSDGCPRKLRGAVAMFGSVELYELVHYGPVGIKAPTTGTDLAYAKMRAGVCGPAERACKPRAVKKLSRSAVFLNVYASATGARRTELLMSRGKLAALSVK